MSYPAARYHSDKGELTASFRPAATEPDLVNATGSMHYLATHASTKGEFGLYRVNMDPGAPGPETHFHKTISESFFVLSGTATLHDGERWIEARAGDFLYVPVGGLHGFRNDADEPLSMLLLFAPGAPREAYFENVAEMARRGGEEFARFLVEHDSYFVNQGYV